jgi:hypothetical protein
MAADYIRVRVTGKRPLKKYITGEEISIPRGSTMSMFISGYRIPAEHRVPCMKDGKRMPPAMRLNDGRHSTSLSQPLLFDANYPLTSKKRYPILPLIESNILSNINKSFIIIYLRMNEHYLIFAFFYIICAQS